MGTSTTLEAVLAHHGVKGMKWGVRRSPAQLRAASRARKDEKAAAAKAERDGPVKAKVNPKTGRVDVKKTVGGGNREVSTDAMRAAVAKQVAKSSGVSSLSNADLKLLNERMNLEQQYARLNPPQKNAGKEFAKNLVLNVAKEQVTRIAKDQATKQIDQLIKGKKG